MSKGTKVAVAFSGGVDSLRAASVLREKGCEVVALHMRILPSSPGHPLDARVLIQQQEDRVRALTSRLDLDLAVVDLREPFQALVVRPFLKGYLEGRTPNPCTVCNPRVKFGLLLEEARKLGASHLATGHYVKKPEPLDAEGRFGLKRGRDRAKDQSYFLYGLSQDQLAASLFPLGESTKEETLRWAREAGFADFLRQESQEICFIPSGRYRDLLREWLPEAPARGPIVDLGGRVMGSHEGLFGYTVGQRRGLGIASTAPYYVVRLDPSSNAVVVGRAEDLYRSELEAEHVNWVSIVPPDEPLEASVRIRNQHVPAPARLFPLHKDRVIVRFREPQRAVTPGQAAVFYRDDLLLGGGVIHKAEAGMQNDEVP